MQVGTKLRSPISSEPHPCEPSVARPAEHTKLFNVSRVKKQKKNMLHMMAAINSTGKKKTKKLLLALQKVFNLNSKAF